jgi:hypothetical protein
MSVLVYGVTESKFWFERLPEVPLAWRKRFENLWNNSLENGLSILSKQGVVSRSVVGSSPT